ncbi:Hpt domain-containing protein [Serpentinimonas barnesii]|uniref:Hpt domain-containing protein n=1 Tax=Serpentinimonas barnesii TaxID=1458427 RepID=UPI0004953B92|nr:Hpt domain-containing protein [Serpentinimonas barnesii]
MNAPLNLGSLTELKSILGEDLYPITEMYAQQLPAEIERLGALLANHDMAAAQQLAHAIKGSSANLGAQELARLAAMVERAALHPPATEAHNAFADMPAVGQQTLQAMRDGGFLLG